METGETTMRLRATGAFKEDPSVYSVSPRIAEQKQL